MDGLAVDRARNRFKLCRKEIAMCKAGLVFWSKELASAVEVLSSQNEFGFIEKEFNNEVSKEVV